MIFSGDTKLLLLNGEQKTLQELVKLQKRQLKNIELLTPQKIDKTKNDSCSIKNIKEIQQQTIYSLQYITTLDNQNYDKQITVGEDSVLSLVSIGNYDQNKILIEDDQGYTIKYVEPIITNGEITGFQLQNYNFQQPEEYDTFMNSQKMLYFWQPTVKQFLQLSFEEQSYFQLFRNVQSQQIKINQNVQNKLKQICNTEDEQVILNNLYILGLIISMNQEKQTENYIIDISEFNNQTIDFISGIINDLNYNFNKNDDEIILFIDNSQKLSQIIKYLFENDDNQNISNKLRYDLIQGLPQKQKSFLLSGLCQQSVFDLSRQNYGYELQLINISDEVFEIVQYLSLQLGFAAFKYKDEKIVAGDILDLILFQSSRTQKFDENIRQYCLDYTKNKYIQIYDQSYQNKQKDNKNQKIILIGMFEQFKLVKQQNNSQQDLKMYLLENSQPFLLADNTIFI